MNREIKFRAWDNQEKRMLQLVKFSWMDMDIDIIDPIENIEGYYLSTPNQGTHKRFHRRSDIEIMQFTGLKDKNGKEIYEGDIVTDEGSGSKGLIEWNNDDASFVVHYHGSSEDYQSFLEMDEWAIIIGNIHETPGLLK